MSCYRCGCTGHDHTAFIDLNNGIAKLNAELARVKAERDTAWRALEDVRGGAPRDVAPMRPWWLVSVEAALERLPLASAVVDSPVASPPRIDREGAHVTSPDSIPAPPCGGLTGTQLADSLAVDKAMGRFWRRYVEVEIAAARAEEREACVKVAETYSSRTSRHGSIAAAIRALGAK